MPNIMATAERISWQQHIEKNLNVFFLIINQKKKKKKLNN